MVNQDQAILSHTTTYSILVVLNLLIVSIIRSKYELKSVSLSQQFNQY